MYSRISYKTYRDSSIADSQFACCPNYVYSSVEDLAKLEASENCLEELSWCRTVGILQSFHGQFNICSMNSTGGVSSDIKILMSMVYLKSPQSIAMVQSIVMPCPVQIFGSIRWHGGKPVIYVKIIQVLTASGALQIKDIMDQLIDLKCHRSVRISNSS